MKLSYKQRQAFFENGYVHLKGVIPNVMLGEIKRAINSTLGEEGMNKDQLAIFRSQTYCPQLSQSEALTTLFYKTPIYELVDSIIDLNQTHPIYGGQTALRFPSMADKIPSPTPHLDGMYTPTNGVQEGTIQNFTALVGVLLSDVPNEDSGNFTVWPQTHQLFETYFNEHGPESLLQGMPPITLPQPIQLKGKAGDVFLCHYQLAHGVAANVSPDIRYACFFRIKHKALDKDWKAPMTNIWMHYRETMQEWMKMKLS